MTYLIYLEVMPLYFGLEICGPYGSMGIEVPSIEQRVVQLDHQNWVTKLLGFNLVIQCRDLKKSSFLISRKLR